MVKIHGTRDGRPFLGIGLVRGNIERLIAGLPIHFNAEEMGLSDIHVKDIIIWFGESEEAIEAEFRERGVLDGTRIIDHRNRRKM